MRKGVILDKQTFGADPLDWSCITDADCDWTSYDHTQPEQTLERIRDAHVVLTNKVVLGESVITKAQNLEYIGVLATGTNNVDLACASEHGITVKNVEGYGTASVAQHTLMLMLNLACKTQAYQALVQQGKWSQSDMFCLLDYPVTELAEKHLVIVGYGELGQKVAKLADAFDMKVSVAARPGTDPSSHVGSGQPDRRPLDALLPSADFVSLHCLLSEQTEKLINAERLALMKPDAYLINTARGGLIDETALRDALVDEHIAGAGLDVLSVEPPPADHPLLNKAIPNLIVTPHNAWASREARQRLLRIAGSHLANFLSEKR